MSDKLYLPEQEFEEWAKKNNINLTIRKNAELTYKSKRTLPLFERWLEAYEKGIDRCLAYIDLWK